MPIDATQDQQLEDISRIMPEYINGLGRLIGLSLINDRLRRCSPIYRNLRNILKVGSIYEQLLQNQNIPRDLTPQRDDNAEYKALTLEIADQHPFYRLDLVKSPIDQRFYAVEIEVDKYHGFGYATFARSLSHRPLGIGLINSIVEISNNSPTGLLLAASERFYLPELQYFADQVRIAGGNLFVGYQYDTEINSEGITFIDGSHKININQLLGIPKLDMSRADLKKFEEKISLLQQYSLLKLLSKHRPILGDKVALSLVSNASKNQELEEILGQCFSHQTLSCLRSFIPSTEFLGISKPERKVQLIEEIEKNTNSYFIKLKDESGARGIAKPGEKDKQIKLIKESGRQIIIQRVIPPDYQTIPFIDVLTGEQGIDDFTIRYGLFVSSKGKLLDLALTASPSPVAHGGVNSILMGAYHAK